MSIRKLIGTAGLFHIGVSVIALLLVFSSPVWAVDTDSDGIDDVDEGIHNGGVDEVLANNGGFESPLVGAGFVITDEDNVPFWDTTATDNGIELWFENHNSVPAYEGDQFAELNANEPAALYQDIATVPGASLRWSVAHRGRSGTDTAIFSAGPLGAELTPVRKMVSPNDNWIIYSGSMVIPAGQTTTRVQFEAIGGGSTGNFLDGFELSMVSRDTDADGTPDYLDDDSDNDGVNDIVEGTADDDGDLLVNYIDPDDYDGDSIPATLDRDNDNDGIPDAAECSGGLSSCGDFDNDGLEDFRDIDSDNDGIPDNVEVQSTAGYIPPGGLYPLDFIDTNNDGLDDTYDDTTAAGMSSGMVGNGFSFDPVAGSAHLNTDTDGDTILDSVESGVIDQATGTGDADEDGLQDRYEGADASDGFVVNDEITDPSADLTNQLGDTTEVGYKEAFTVPTVTALTTSDNTPMVVGTHTSAAELSVMVNSVTYEMDSSAVLLDHGDDTWTLSIATELSDGTYDVAVTSTSLTGDLSDTTTDELVIDTTAPQPNLSIDAITADNVLNVEEANNTSYSVTGTVTGDFRENDMVTLTIGETEYSGPVDASGSYSIDVPTSELSANTLISGRVDTVDQGGTAGSGAATQPYVVDLVPPQVTGSVSSGGYGEDIGLAGSSDEPEGSTVTVSNADGDVICSTVLDAVGNWACSGENTGNITQQVLTATIVDPAGNTTSSVLGTTDALDSDNDGIADSIEGTRDSDGDDVVDSLDLDSDNDGLPDAYEAGIVADNSMPIDTDGDGIPDYRDRDSDNDGLSDTLESQGLAADTDRNGVLDDFTDNDGDGQDDGNAAFPVTPEDVDTDGNPDHLDIDTDGDGTLDIVEGGATSLGDVDSDSDGALDSMTDSDGDLIPDVVDWDMVGGLDTDGDGIVDSADVDTTGGLDTDGDGIDDLSDPDANGDGMADLFGDSTQSPPLPDVNGDNIPDVDQAGDSALETTEGIYRTGLQGVGCSVAYGTDTRDFMLPILGLFALAGVFIRRRKVLPCVLKHSRLSTFVLLGAGCSALALVPIDTLQAAEGDASESNLEQEMLTAEPVSNDEAFQRRIYVGFGLGRSWVEPDTSEVDGVGPNDRVHLGGQITVGADLKKWLSMELHAATLGDAGLSNGDSISYDQVGVSALLYVGGARNRFNRRGFTGFGRVGLGGLINKSELNSGVSYKQENAAHLTLGLGAEFATRMGLALRAEGIVFDQDANYLQLGLLYRFGRRPENVRDETVVHKPNIPSPKPTGGAQTTEPDTLVIVDAVDNDGDGIEDSVDQCPATAAGLAVEESGCAIFNGVIEGLTFKSASAELTPESRDILDDIADTLKRLSEMTFELTAHTDNVGDADMNMALSIQRARSVAAYLVQTGIPVSRFTARAFGELRPIATNATAEGRRTNRRVELVVTRQED